MGNSTIQVLVMQLVRQMQADMDRQTDRWTDRPKNAVLMGNTIRGRPSMPQFPARYWASVLNISSSREVSRGR